MMLNKIKQEVIENAQKEQEEIEKKETGLNPPLDEHIAMWRKEHKQIFKTVIQDDIFIWRKLKRSEYKEITKWVSETYKEDSQEQNWARQDEITKTVLLYPIDAEEAIEESAGISVVISQDCLIRSGFGAVTQQM